MIDLELERKAFNDWHFLTYGEFVNWWDDAPASWIHNDRWKGCISSAESKQAEIDSLKAQLEQAEKVWISTDFMLPDEDEAVLFLDKNNTIHDGYLSTDYVDGPYGENGEDFGDNQTLWSSNSNGEEFLPCEIKYWMPRPGSKSGSSAGEQS